MDHPDQPSPYSSKYVMLGETGNDPGTLRPPPYRRNIPRYHSKPNKRQGSCFLKCMCCCYCFLFIFILVVSATMAYLYNHYKPQIPTYNVQNLDVGAFQVRPDFSLYTEFIVKVKAENPNEKIGIKYGKDSKVVVMYTDSTLCLGKLPSFHQGHKNVTIMDVVLKGESKFGSGLQGALMENRHKKRIPLDINVRVPVVIVLGNFPLRQLVVVVHCSLVVDSLSPKKKVQILSSKYDIGVEF